MTNKKDLCTKLIIQIRIFSIVQIIIYKIIDSDGFDLRIISQNLGFSIQGGLT